MMAFLLDVYLVGAAFTAFAICWGLGSDSVDSEDIVERCGYPLLGAVAAVMVLIWPVPFVIGVVQRWKSGKDVGG